MKLRSRAAGWQCPDCGKYFHFGRTKFSAKQAVGASLPFAYHCPQCDFEVEFRNRPVAKGREAILQQGFQIGLILAICLTIFAMFPVGWALRDSVTPDVFWWFQFPFWAIVLAGQFALIAIGEGMHWRFQVRVADATGEWVRHLAHDPLEGPPIVITPRARPRKDRSRICD